MGSFVIGNPPGPFVPSAIRSPFNIVPGGNAGSFAVGNPFGPLVPVAGLGFGAGLRFLILHYLWLELRLLCHLLLNGLLFCFCGVAKLFLDGAGGVGINLL